MLIGVVGLISSGKGTVADRLVEKHGYQKDSFAKSLKDAVRQCLIGIEPCLKEIQNPADIGGNNQTSFGARNLASQPLRDGCCSTLAQK